MLIEKGFSQGDTVSIKLLSGEELIARWESENDLEIKIEKPMAVTLTHNGIGMVPWLFLGDSDRSYSVKKTAISTIVKSKKEAADQYIQGTTGIALTSTRSLM